MENIRKIQIVSSLEKIFPNSGDNFSSFGFFSMLKNEKKSFQLVFKAEKGEKIEFSVKSPLEKNMRFSYVKLIPAKLTLPCKYDDYYLDSDRREFPDLLEPTERYSFNAKYDGLNSVWVQISGKIAAGSYESIFSCGDDSAIIKTEVIDAELPEQELIYTNWFHTDCLMSYYGFSAFSQEYWKCTENFLRRAAEYGMNCVLTPLFTPPLDTKIGLSLIHI